MQNDNRMRILYHMCPIGLLSRSVIFSLLCLINIPAFSQRTSDKSKIKTQLPQYKNTDFYAFPNELGIHVTQILANIFSLSANSETSPYSLTYRRHMKSLSFRLGMHVSYDQDQQEEFGNATFIIRDLTTSRNLFRLGVEKHLPVGRKFIFSYGADLLGGLDLENSNITENTTIGTNVFASSQQSITLGAGPVIRLDYKLTDRMLLSTESSLYATYRNSQNKISINGIPSEDPSSSGLTILLALPQSLYFNICF
ncbi:MAG: hypothetical protein LW630_02465 [Saprospiraceae bacterium]|nr:hypothetical protein [Saprospiraceae bacterium]